MPLRNKIRETKDVRIIIIAENDAFLDGSDRNARQPGVSNRPAES